MVEGTLACHPAAPPRVPAGHAATDTAARLKIVLVACFLDEEAHIRELLASLAGQTRLPDRLLLVDDGSTDDSPRLARAFAKAHPWATLLRRPPHPAQRDRLAGAPELQAFQWAVRAHPEEWDVIAKLDADVSFNPRLVDTIERAFLADPGLGIAGGYLSVQRADGVLMREHCPPGHVRGATKFYRRACYEAIDPVPGILGWDTIDEISARMHGWRTATVSTRGGDSLHLRPTSTRDGALRGYRRVGACAWGYGAHPLHVMLGTLARLARAPRVLGGLNYAIGWGAAGLSGAPRASARVRAFGRGEQLRRMSMALARRRPARSAPAAVSAPADVSPPAAVSAPAATDAPSEMDAPHITRESVGRALSWAGVGHFISQATWFASLLVLAALVPPRAFGVVSAGMVIVSIAVLLVGSGTRGGIIVSKRIEIEHLRYALWLTTLAGLALTGLVMLLAAPIVSAFASGADPTVLQGLILSVGMFGLSVVPMAVLQKQMQFKREAMVMSLASIIASIAALVAAMMGAGVWALVGRQVLWSALMAAFAWIAARSLLPSWRELIGRPQRPDRIRRPNAGWFFTLALFSLVAMSVDYLIVGHMTDATQLGLYSLAFSLAFAPLTQISWRLGGVLLPAVAATGSLEAVGRRTLLAMSTTATLMLPVVPVAAVLAPWLLPAVFGERWTGMVTPFQILLPVGVAQAVLNMMGESLAGSGSVHIHAKMQMVWAVSIVPALIVLVGVDGITGAAIAHLVVLAPVAAGYLLWGSRTLGLGLRAVARALAIVVPVALQTAATLLVLIALRHAGAPVPVSDTLAAVSGLLVIGAFATLRCGSRLRDARHQIFTLVGRSSGEPSSA